jgi:hypothetical protein
VGQHIAALVLEKPANKKLRRSTFGADVVQEGTVTNELSQSVVNGLVDIRRPPACCKFGCPIGLSIGAG